MDKNWLTCCQNSVIGRDVIQNVHYKVVIILSVLKGMLNPIWKNEYCKVGNIHGCNFGYIRDLLMESELKSQQNIAKFI